MKRIIAVILLVVVVFGLFTGCTREAVRITEKEATSWLSPITVNNRTNWRPRHGWIYTGVTDNGEEVVWRDSKDYQIGEVVNLLLQPMPDNNNNSK